MADLLTEEPKPKVSPKPVKATGVNKDGFEKGSKLTEAQYATFMAKQRLAGK